MSSSIFIVATDTDAGKTWVTTQLFKQFQDQGLAVRALKPIACGVQVAPSNESAALNEDVQQLCNIQPQRKISDINFKTYHQPLAPALAAKVEGAFSPEALLLWIGDLQHQMEITLIETVGGLMTPLLATDGNVWLVSDWLQQMLDTQVLLVLPLRLGCMNQALLACAELQRLDRSPTWIVFNDLDGNGTADETITILMPCLKRLFGHVPKLLISNQGQQTLQL